MGLQTSETITEVVGALVKVQTEFKALEKTVYSEFTNSSYTPLQEIMKYLMPLTTANGLFITQNPVTRHDEQGAMTLGVETRIFHSSGEWIHYPEFEMDVISNKKMSTAQEAGSTITYAKRYAIAAIFGIVSDEDKDGVQPQGTKGKFKPKSNEPMTIEKARAFKLTFGKNKDKTVGELAQEDMSYLGWLYRQERTDPELKEAIKLVGYESKKKQEEQNLNQTINNAMDMMPDNNAE